MNMIPKTPILPLMKSPLKSKAIHMRQEGHSYAEILREVPVAKSTLSLWFGSIGLSQPQKQRITLKRIAAAQRGASKRRQTRLEEIASYLKTGSSQVGKISTRELWLLGIALYWAEGSKQRDSNISVGVQFTNSDSTMAWIFLKWLTLMGILADAICFELYVHETRKQEILAFKTWWANQLRISPAQIDRVYFKKGNPKTNRKNIEDLYHGLIRIKVKSSTRLNRKINGWVGGIVSSVGDGVTGNTSAFGAEDSRFDP